MTTLLQAVYRHPTFIDFPNFKDSNKDAVEKLKGSLDCTDWDVFVDSSSDISELSESMCGYIDFCVECTVPQKTVKFSPLTNPG